MDLKPQRYENFHAFHSGLLPVRKIVVLAYLYIDMVFRPHSFIDNVKKVMSGRRTPNRQHAAWRMHNNALSCTKPGINISQNACAV